MNDARRKSKFSGAKNFYHESDSSRDENDFYLKNRFGEHRMRYGRPFDRELDSEEARAGKEETRARFDKEEAKKRLRAYLNSELSTNKELEVNELQPFSSHDLEAYFDDDSYQEDPQSRRDDQELEYWSLNLLSQDPVLADENIFVELRDNVLYLRGRLDTRWKKKRAEMLLEAVPHITDIQNMIKIKSSEAFSPKGWIPDYENIEDQI